MRICSKFSVKCEASHNNKSRLFYAVRAGTEQEEIVYIYKNVNESTTVCLLRSLCSLALNYCVSVICQINCVGGITWIKHSHAQSQYWAVKSDQ